jgi:hypothetical protein
VSWRTAASERFFQALLIGSLLAFSWLGMMAVHELGHVLHARLSGGTVVQVILHPAAISRTDVSPNPSPLFVAWGGAIWGCLLPLSAWAVTRSLTPRLTYLFAFFAGFCLIANGAYLGGGAFTHAGDAGDLLRHGAPLWQLLLFAVFTVPAGLYLWNGLGRAFGLGPSPQPVDRPVAIWVTIAALLVATAEAVLSAAT